MFPHVSSVQDTWRHRGGSATIVGLWSHGSESTRSLIEHGRKWIVSEALDGRHVASRGEASLHWMALIESWSIRGMSSSQGFIGRLQSITISAITWRRVNGWSDRDRPTYLIRSNDWHASRKRSTRSWLDHAAIVTHPWRNRGTWSPHLCGPRLSWNRGH